MTDLYTMEQRLKRMYNITLEDFETLLKLQGKLCAICKEPKVLVVDHDHETEKVRGLLCYACNTGLGQFKDDPRLLDAAVLYLEDSRKPKRTKEQIKKADRQRLRRQTI